MSTTSSATPSFATVPFLREYQHSGNEGAFTQVVRHHVAWLFAVALRITGHEELAREACQDTFTTLARKAPQLPSEAAFTAWIHKTMVFSAKNLRAKEMRHQRKLERAVALDTTTATLDPGGDIALAELHACLARLDPTDRQLIIGRFWLGHSWAELATTMGSTAEALRKRSERTLQKIERMMQGKRLGLAALPWTAFLAAPEPATASTPSITQLTEAALAQGKSLPFFAWVTHFIYGKLSQHAIASSIGALCLVAAAYYWKSAPSPAASEATPHRPAHPRVTAETTNLLASQAWKALVATLEKHGRTYRSFEDSSKVLESITLARLTPWINSQNRDAASLLAAWELTHDPQIEAELIEKHSHSPMVCVALLYAEDSTVKEEWLQRLRVAAPHHSLPHCLAAATAIRSKDWEATETALTAALVQTEHTWFNKERLLKVRDAARTVGLDPRDAAVAPFQASFLIMNSQNRVFNRLGVFFEHLNTDKLSSATKQRRAALAIGMVHCRDTTDSLSTIARHSVYKRALQYLPPDTLMGDSEQTLQEASTMTTPQFLSQKDRALLETALGFASAPERDEYLDRMLINEWEAQAWILQKAKDEMARHNIRIP